MMRAKMRAFAVTALPAAMSAPVRTPLLSNAAILAAASAVAGERR